MKNFFNMNTECNAIWKERKIDEVQFLLVIFIWLLTMQGLFLDVTWQKILTTTERDRQERRKKKKSEEKYFRFLFKKKEGKKTDVHLASGLFLWNISEEKTSEFYELKIEKATIGIGLRVDLHWWRWKERIKNEKEREWESAMEKELLITST